MKNTTGYVSDSLYLKHSLGIGHPESPERLKAIESEMKQSGLNTKVVPLAFEIEDPRVWAAIKCVHSEEHIASVTGSGTAGKTAFRAVKGVLQAVDDIYTQKIDNVFCAVRPPGHHSHNNGAHFDGRSQGEGFCFYNNAAIAARYAQKRYTFSRILLVDWDYHHGNGTEWAFYGDPEVFFFSTHILWGYPGTGFPEKKGEGAGTGYNLNIPLPDGAGDSDIISAWTDAFLPALKKVNFSPDLVIISAGFDSREEDPLGTFRITDDGYARLTRMAMDIADKHCEGRVLSVLEGGYNPEGLAKAVVSHVSVLLGGS